MELFMLELLSEICSNETFLISLAAHESAEALNGLSLVNIYGFQKGPAADNFDNRNA